MASTKYPSMGEYEYSDFERFQSEDCVIDENGNEIIIPCYWNPFLKCYVEGFIEEDDEVADYYRSIQ